MLTARNVRVRSLEPSTTEVSWETGVEHDALDYTFQVVRSESAEGPFDPVSPVFEDRYLFVDRNIPEGLTYRKIWYRVRVTRKEDSKVWESASTAVGAEPTADARYMRNQEGALFRNVIGREVWLFKQRTFGARCGCFDPVMQVQTRTHCEDCFSTGFLRGYHHPIVVSMQIDPEGKRRLNNSMQIDTKPQTMCRMSYYPDLNPGDIIVEGENVRWKVDQVSQSQRARATIMQTGVLFRIQPTDIEYRLPLNLDTAWRDIQPTPKTWFANAKQLDEIIEQYTPDLFGGFEREE